MINGEFFTLTLPTSSTNRDPIDPVVIADGCETNSNYYTSGHLQGTCCCGCDKIVY